MDYKLEVDSLIAHAVAIDRVVIQLCRGLAAISPELGRVVAMAFDEAASQIESTAILFGEAARPEHIIKAGRMVEDLRAQALRDDNPR